MKATLSETGMSPDELHVLNALFDEGEGPDSQQDTSRVEIPEQVIDRIVGQDRAVEMVRLAARQRRFLLIVGEPGTGKSLLGRATADLLELDRPEHRLQDLVAFENSTNPSQPEIRAMATGEGAAAVLKARQRTRRSRASESFLFYTAAFASAFLGVFFFLREDRDFWYLIVGGLGALFFAYMRRRAAKRGDRRTPRILVGHADAGRAPFVDATGTRDGALLGDVRHDPYQSGGSETSPHHLLEAGAIHRAHRGVLYIDEIATISMESQQSLLTALQRRAMPILGRSPGSSGTMVQSNAAPCDCLLVVAGNVEDVQHIHPALRSRIRGYGYEIYTKSVMPVNRENARALVRFVAQEVRSDGRIPHFSKAAVACVLAEARRRSGREHHYTLRLRELGGLVRVAGDLAVLEDREARRTESHHVKRALSHALSLEEQMARELRTPGTEES
ncbi:MAG: AAA family ATPase [bacterium]|nr:AAA family ATPase [bacterium]